MNKEPGQTKHYIMIEIPENAFDVRIGTDMSTRGLLFKTPSQDGAGWRGHFISFGSVGQSPVAMNAKRIVRDNMRVYVYAKT